jgi:hypothetical protein
VAFRRGPLLSMDKRSIAVLGRFVNLLRWRGLAKECDEPLVGQRRIKDYPITTVLGAESILYGTERPSRV